MWGHKLEPRTPITPKARVCGTEQTGMDVSQNRNRPPVNTNRSTMVHSSQKNSHMSICQFGTSMRFAQSDSVQQYSLALMPVEAGTSAVVISIDLSSRKNLGAFLVKEKPLAFLGSGQTTLKILDIQALWPILLYMSNHGSWC